MGNFFNNLSGKLQAFMMGRNGADTLAIWSLGASLVMLVINMFAPNIVCSVLSYVFLFYSIYRMFSTNVAYRQQENEKFEQLLDKLAFWKRGSGSSGAAGKAQGAASKPAKGAKSVPSDKLEFKCEQCGQSLSVPRGRGTLKVTCPKCHHQQKVKS